MAQNTTTPNAAALASAGIFKLNGARYARPKTLKALRKMGFRDDIIENSMSILDEQIRTTREGQVMMMDFRLGPFGPIAIVETP